MDHTCYRTELMAKPSARSPFNRRRVGSTPSQRLGCCPKASSRAQQQQRSPAQHVWFQRALSGVLTSAACLGLLLQAPVQAKELSIAFPASSNPEIRRAQQTMVESWAYVQALYLDPSFSHTDWTKALQDALAESFKAGSDSEVTKITNRLLATLGDPYTRLLQGDDAQALAAEEQGKIVATGLGLQPIILTGQLSTPPASDPAAAPPDGAYQDKTNPSMIAMAAATGNAYDAAAAATARSDESHQGGYNKSSVIAVAAATATSNPTPSSSNPSSSSSADPMLASEEYSSLGSSSSSEKANDPAAAAAALDSHEVLLVSFVVSGSPAAAAGVQQGDVLLEVQGEPVAGRELRQVYKLLSKESDVTLLRQPELSSLSYTVSTQPSSSSSSAVPPVTQITPADSAAPPGSSSSSRHRSVADLLPGYSPERVYTVHLKPEVLDFAPVQYGVIKLGKTSDGSSGSSSSSSSGPQVGYLKLLTFGATAPQQVAEALIDMQQQQQDLTQRSSNLQQQQQGTPGNSQPQQQQQQQLSGIILDLRDNPGGIVEAGVDIAVDFLHQGQVLCVAVDKSGEEERVVLPTTHTLTDLPLVILVNKSTASTSELVAGALHDELNAPLIGTTTYGKGRTQRVIQLADGTSTLLVSTMKYFTPKHTEIDRVGLKPDVVCDPPEVIGQQWVGGKQDAAAGSLLEDPCIKLAAEHLAGTVKSVAVAIAK